MWMNTARPSAYVNKWISDTHSLYALVHSSDDSFSWYVFLHESLIYMNFFNTLKKIISAEKIQYVGKYGRK